MSARSTANRGTNPKDQSYKRGYVACLGCRARKVRCVLGNKPPCAKCVREHRECIFQSSRKAGKHREPPRWARARDNPPEPGGPRPGAAIADRANGGLNHLGQTSDSPSTEHQQAQGLSSRNDPYLSGPVMSTILARPRDALDVLFDAAQPEQQAVDESRTTERLPGLMSSPSTRSTTSTLVSESGLVSVSGLSRPADDVLDLWDKCRFVRQGWFTAQEGVTYLDLFYQYLAPVSPVLTECYRDHANHESLIMEEPMLCCTLLMISSRYFVLPGAGGVSRSHFIHQRLWQYCELLIRRIMLGQEKHSTAKTRVLGSIESLILISDWHPRSVHFPPETEGWDGELISPAYDRRNRLQTDDDVPLIRWREDVFEPAKRSERISWMLLGAAVSLAHELGVFTEGSAISSNTGQNIRIHRTKKLLYIYVTQMAVKLGCPSVLPDSISHMVSVAPPYGICPIEKQWESYMSLWIQLTGLMKTASAMFFQSMAHVKQNLLSGNYNILLQHFAPSLVNWYEEYRSLSPDIPEPLKFLLLIEYYYLKVYTSSLAIQAVVERALVRGHSRINDPSGVGVDACLLPQDQAHIRDVILDSEKVLELATSMGSQGRLRYAPLRTLVNVTSSSVFLLKAISLGARNAELQTSLRILDGCIAALRNSGTDDMDFSLRYATLIEKHVARFRAGFVPPNPPLAMAETEGTQQATTVFPVVQDSELNPESHHLNGSQTRSLWDPVQTEDDWWTRPFDPNIAPFSSTSEGVSLGLELDSLDFLWNLPGIGGE